jgi:hypothetical protein
VVLAYPPVGSSCIWVCLLNKCEISNSYCRVLLGGANNVFKVKKYCFLTEKKGCDRATSPLYEPRVYLHFEIWTLIILKCWPLSWLAKKAQWQNTEFIYAEILNKTSLALIFTSNIFYIFFSFIIKLCCISFYFCPCKFGGLFSIKNKWATC